MMPALTPAGRWQGASRSSGAALVLGGGVAGIQCSLDLAEGGYKVYLVEKQPALGGHMAQLDKTFPTNDCAMCTLAPKLVEAGRLVAASHRVDSVVALGGGSSLDCAKAQRLLSFPLPRFTEWLATNRGAIH